MRVIHTCIILRAKKGSDGETMLNDINSHTNHWMESLVHSSECDSLKVRLMSSGW